ncbi:MULTISPECIES: cobalt transporter CbiM [unclassified Pseudodesulfovibrio]|uniref:cobalt transporter CbiM n=1 Tax=unclassified Pseudodesulfovibrio TaxID=2661612 RepID=UPI000FEC1B91|nr:MULTISPECIES: cobalt transporter CbiM [unclassified Pseudodesulfovibrio]MCJ2164877.1 cobalt transporter CbiM [Pseudodesulfovibrio sp. S3-i]RWU03755.1 cobalt transporter CbiM [Pseudodesulfovibrio sp. S3]
MHISEGVLSWPVLLGGASLTVAGTAMGLKKIDYDQIMSVAILSAAFFIASLIHVPIGPANGHLILNGLLGVVLGWAAFPCILVGLTLQAVLFQYGGLTVLGLNCFNMAAPAVVCFYVFRPMLSRHNGGRFVAAFSCGFLAMLLSAALTATSLALSGEAFREAAKVLFYAHLPIMVVEGLITAFAYSFLAKVKPEVLAA